MSRWDVPLGHMSPYRSKVHDTLSPHSASQWQSRHPMPGANVRSMRRSCPLLREHVVHLVSPPLKKPSQTALVCEGWNHDSNKSNSVRGAVPDGAAARRASVFGFAGLEKIFDGGNAVWTAHALGHAIALEFAGDSRLHPNCLALLTSDSRGWLGAAGAGAGGVAPTGDDGRCREGESDEL